MTLRRAILSSIFLVPVAAVIGLACSAPDPGEVTFSTNPAKIKFDSGVIVGGDAAAVGEGGTIGAPPSAFDGQPQYISGSGASTDEAQHQQKFGNMNPAGQDCLSCHGPDGGSMTKFTMAGTIFPPDAGGSDAGANNVEVRVKNPDGTMVAAYTNSEGNFYALAAVGSPILANSIVGARNMAGTQDMPDHLTGPTQGSCNQKGTCHGGTQGTIHVP
ncbi:MAG: hypothetical protein ABI461_03585 [Polyangiaceae bacterium]